MFTLTDTPVKFVGLLVLFIFCTLWSIYQLSRKQSGVTLVSNILHLIMSVVMLAMVPRSVWKPITSVAPNGAFAIFFAVVTLWFVFLGIRVLRSRADDVRRHALHAFGHGAMFGAMAWHLFAMQAKHAAMKQSQAMGGMHGANHLGHDGAGMSSDPKMIMMTAAIVGVPFMAYLLAASIITLKNAIVPGADILDQNGHRNAGHGHYEAGNPRLGSLADFSMNFGMFWMSTGIMVPLLPFFAMFAF